MIVFFKFIIGSINLASAFCIANCSANCSANFFAFAAASSACFFAFAAASFVVSDTLSTDFVILLPIFLILNSSL